MRKSTNLTATSPAAMGKALVILATSCAALSGSGQSTIPTRRASQQRSSRMHHPTSSSRRGNDGMESIMALHYRDGDEDQPLDMQAANRGAVASEMDPTKSARPHARVATPNGRVSTKFFIAPIVRLMPVARPSSTSTAVAPNASSSKTTSSKSKEEDERQLVMDEYLEFVERRYSRMHPKHNRPQHGKKAGGMRRRPKVVLDFHLPRKIFLSTLALHSSSRSSSSSSSPSTSTSLEEAQTVAVSASSTAPPAHSSASRTAAGYAAAAARQAKDDDDEEDPLNVLGLTDLASSRLRQRLHVPRDLRDEHMLLTSGTTSAVNFFHHMVHLNDHHHHHHAVPPSSSRSSSSSKDLAEVTKEGSGGRNSSYISLSFTAQFQLLLATIQRIALAFVNTVKIMAAFGSRIFSEILDKGGFRHSVRMISVASVAILLMFKPLFRGALKHQG